MNYTTKEIAIECEKHITTINKTIVKLGIIPVDKKCVGKSRLFFYSEEQKEIIKEFLKYKPKQRNSQNLIYINCNYYIYESKMNYLNEL